VLRRIFGPKRKKKVLGNWRRLHSKELRNICLSPNITRVIKSRRVGWMGLLARTGDMRDAYKILVGKPEGKRPFGRPRRRWEDTIGMDIRELGWKVVNCIHLAKNKDQRPAFVSTVMKLPVS
jgi:hypothetical protein